ncbi:MAG: hypothetical protein GY829_12455 [Gammaproteobacteria bacterium]|nr:hypothetical protein [Gammaproteobacteria bacterium]
MRRPKKPKPTPQQIAQGTQMRASLNKEIEESERRLKTASRGKLGRVSLLSGASRTTTEAATGARTGAGSGGAGSMLPGTGSSGASGGGRSPRGMRGFGRR